MSATASQSGNDFIEVINPEGMFPCMITCDHAGASIPEDLSNLGLSDEALKTHIASDLHIADVARQVAHALDATLVMTHVSRLVVDCNRWLDDPNSMPSLSDGVAIPANTNLKKGERDKRANRYFWPYHQEITNHLARLRTRVESPFFLGLHSFTPQLGTEIRHQVGGTFWHRDSLFSDMLITAINAKTDLPIGNNVPFSAHDGVFCLDYHTWPQNIPSTGFEIRDDHISTAQGRTLWAEFLISALPNAIDAHRKTAQWNENSKDTKAAVLEDQIW